MDDQKDRLKLFLKSCLLFLYSQLDRPANVTSRNCSVVKLCWLLFSIQEASKIIPLLLHSISCWYPNSELVKAQDIHFNVPSVAEGLELSQVNLSGLSPSLWLTFEKVEGSQASTSQQSQPHTQGHKGRHSCSGFTYHSSLTLSHTTHHRIKDNSIYVHSTPSLSQLLDALSMSQHTSLFYFSFLNLGCLFSSSLCSAATISLTTALPSNHPTSPQRIKELLLDSLKWGQLFYELFTQPMLQ